MQAISLVISRQGAMDLPQGKGTSITLVAEAPTQDTADATLVCYIVVQGVRYD